MSQTERIWWYIAMDCDESNKECFTQWQNIHIAALVPTFFSIVASLIIIIAGIKYHKKLSHLSLAAQLPIYISISDLIFEIFHGGDHIHSVTHNYIFSDTWCIIFGSMKTFGVNIHSAWALGVSVYLIRTIYYHAGDEMTFGKHNIYLHACCWGAPLIIFFFGFIFNTYGKSLGPWCDVADPGTHFLMVDIWMVLVIFALIINYGLIIYKLRRVIKTSGPKSKTANEHNYDRMHTRMKKVMRMVGFYPVAFIAQWFAYMVYLTNLVPQTYATTLWVVSNANCGGIFNLFLYGPLLLNQIRSHDRSDRIRKSAKRVISNTYLSSEAKSDDNNGTETKDSRANACVSVEISQNQKLSEKSKDGK